MVQFNTREAPQLTFPLIHTHSWPWVMRYDRFESGPQPENAFSTRTSFAQGVCKLPKFSRNIVVSYNISISKVKRLPVRKPREQSLSLHYAFNAAGKNKFLSVACLVSPRINGDKSTTTVVYAATRITSRNFSSSKAVNMRFVQFVNKNGGPQHLGVQLTAGGDIIAVSAVNSRIPNNLKKFLEGGEELLKKAKRIVAEGRSVIPESEVNFLPPVREMDKVVCVGLNYSGHCKEQGKELPESPMIFSKFPSNIVGPNDNVVLPSISDKVDWEAELAIVIGKKCKGLDNHEAEDCIFGYTVAQDISARDWQKGKRNGGQFLLGKAMDTFCPLGPAVVTKEAICDINNLTVKTWVNGDLKQDGNTCELVFKPHDIVAYISQFFTLLPGDVILTGTPGGVGFARNPPEFLKKGDVLETEISSLGRLKNNVV